LLSEVDNALKAGVQPERIGFLSFSKKAATEAVSRARVQFNLPRSRFKYFRTLHSLAFERLGFTRNRVFSPGTLHQFAAWMGLDLTFSHFDDEMQYVSATDDDKALFTINLARIRRQNLREAANEAELDWHLVKTLDYGMRRFKKERNLVDFTDMIEQFVKAGTSPDFDLLCIDEAQDMSHLQWEMAHILEEHAKRTIIAGDDDQAIFGWAGADTEEFQRIASTGPVRVLDQSYRVPVHVQDIANRVIRRCSNRVAKEWHPRGAVGSVASIDSIEECDLASGTWLILARNAYLLSSVFEHLSEIANRPNITVSTIHRAKGGEADNVVLFTDMARRSYEQVESDEEARVWYVGITRARTNLYLVEPRTQCYYELL